MPHPGAADDAATALDDIPLDTLEAIQQRVLWLAVRMVDHANHERPDAGGIKVGGHQASSASMVSIMTALWFAHLGPDDRVSVKPHASPVLHAIQYLLGDLDRSYLTTLRAFSGLQAYPSRTKDPDRVDFSTGSVGLGAVAPVFAALAARYAHTRFGAVSSDRFISLIGDAELDEGNVWETVAEEAIQGLGNVIWIIDLNRQSLDRVIPGVRAARLKALFAGAGWKVLEAKYGSRLEAAMTGSGGDVLRRRIDEMSNEEYQALIRLRDGAEMRRRLADVPQSAESKDILLSVADIPDEDLGHVISNLAGHDLPRLLEVLAEADAVPDSPVVVFAYTIKGFGLPLAGDPLNHSMLLTQMQMDELQAELGVPADDVWADFPGDSIEGQWCAERGAAFSASAEAIAPPLPASAVPDRLGATHPALTSTQEAMGRALIRLADADEVGERVITLSPDVATSTHLAG